VKDHELGGSRGVWDRRTCKINATVNELEVDFASR
jgi:hypothetical protein